MKMYIQMYFTAANTEYRLFLGLHVLNEYIGRPEINMCMRLNKYVYEQQKCKM
jgi:hypothetical protein